MRRGIRQRIDDLQLLDDRAGPAVRDDERQRVRMCSERTWMKWMSSPSISVMNCGSAFSFASTLAPVVICRPIVRELLHRRELHALRCVCDRFLSQAAGSLLSVV